MRNRRNDLFYIIANILFIILYNIIFFVMISNRTLGFWISYAFTMGAFIIVLALELFLRRTRTKGEAINIRFSFWITMISYEVVQLVAGIVLAIIPFPIGIKITLQCALLFIFIVMILILYASKERSTVNQDMKKQKVGYVNKTLLMVEQLSNRYNDDTKVVLDKLYGILRYSDPMSSIELEGMEQEIVQKLNALVLNTVSDEKDVTNKIEECIKLAEERNRLCLMLK